MQADTLDLVARLLGGAAQFLAPAFGTRLVSLCDLFVKLLGVAAQCSAIFFGALVVGWQLNRQHKNTLEAQRLQAERQQKLEVYQVIAKALREADEAVSNQLNEITTLCFEVKGGKSLPHERTDAIKSTHLDADAKLWSVTWCVAQWEIVFDPFPETTETLFSKQVACGQAFIALYTAVLDAPPSEEKIISLADNYCDSCRQLRMSVTTVLSELQNLLLGDLFKARSSAVN